MTREEAEKIAAKLVTTKDESFDYEDKRYPAWEVLIGGMVIDGYIHTATSAEMAEERANVWRAAIVQTLLKD